MTVPAEDRLRSRLYTTHRIVADTPESLVLQANWLGHLLGALIPFLGSAIMGWILWTHPAADDKDDLVAVVCLTSLAGLGLLILGSGLINRRNRVTFDRLSRRVRFDKPPKGAPREIPFARLRSVLIKSRTVRSRRGRAFIYSVCIVTREHTEPIKITSTGLSEVAELLAKKLAEVCGLPAP